MQKQAKLSYTQRLTNFLPFNWFNNDFKIGYKYKIIASELKPDIFPVFQYNPDWEAKYDTIRSEMIKNNTW